MALLLVLPVAASGQQRTFASTFLEGSWALRLDGANVMRWDLELTADGWTGAWSKPTKFSSDGTRFGNIELPAVDRRADSGRAIGDWAELTFNDPRPGEEPDQFRIRLTSNADRAEMIYVGTGLPPFTLVRVPAGTPLGPFEAGKAYGAPRTGPAAAASPGPAATPSAAPPPPLPPIAAPRTVPAPAPSPRATPTPRPTAPPADDEVQGPPAMIGR